MNAQIAAPGAKTQARTVRISSGSVHLEGELTLPAGATGVVLVAPGRGSGRHSPRDQFVAHTIAAAELGPAAGAVVSRGGRPDLAGEALCRVQSPTLLIVGERDELVIQLNEQAYAQLRCEKELKIVPRATHLFEEPGALEIVARL